MGVNGGSLNQCKDVVRSTRGKRRGVIKKVINFEKMGLWRVEIGFSCVEATLIERGGHVPRLGEFFGVGKQ